MSLIGSNQYLRCCIDFWQFKARNDWQAVEERPLQGRVRRSKSERASVRGRTSAPDWVLPSLIRRGKSHQPRPRALPQAR